MKPTLSGIILPLIAVLGLSVTADAAQAKAQAQQAQANTQSSRGALLYNTHCIACHTTEVHWRSKRLVTDWASLNVQVRRWQDAQRLGWNEDDITQVARHLDRRFYKFRERGSPSGPSAALERPMALAPIASID